MRQFLILVSLLLLRGCLSTEDQVDEERQHIVITSPSPSSSSSSSSSSTEKAVPVATTPSTTPTPDCGLDQTQYLVFGDKCPSEDWDISLPSGQAVTVQCVLSEDKQEALVKMEMSCEYARKTSKAEIGEGSIRLNVDMRMDGMRCSCVYFNEEMPTEGIGNAVTVTIKTTVCLSRPTISIDGRESETNISNFILLEGVHQANIRCYTHACESILEWLILTCDYEVGNQMVGKTEVNATIRIDMIVQTCECKSLQRDGTIQKTVTHVASKSLTCETRKWMHLEEKETHITVVEMDRSWKHAKSVCEQLGSHLYNIMDVDTDNFLSMISDDPSATYWFGDINRKAKTKGNGTSFSNRAGSLEQKYNSDAKTCELISPATGDLSKADCHSPSHFICESKEPCKHRPGLVVNGGMALGDRNISMVKQSDVKIECLLLGNADKVSFMLLRCDARMDRRLDVSAPEGGVLLIEANRNAHERNCSCTSILKEGNQLQVNITFNITWPPMYADGFSVKEIVKAPRARTATIKLELNSNPKPTDYWLQVDEKSLLKSFYRIEFRQDSSYDFTVTLSIPKKVAYPGRVYSLFIVNGVLDGFNYSFQLKHQKYKAIFLNNGFMKNLLLPILSVFVCFSLTCLVVWRRSRVNSVFTRSMSKDDSSSASVDSREVSLALEAAYEALWQLPPGMEMTMLQYMKEIEFSDTKNNKRLGREKTCVTQQSDTELEVEN